jgi:cell division protein FtsB
MITNGIDVGEMQIKLLQKIEELTLYVIELKRENEVMRGDNAEMKVEIEKLKNK